MNQATFTGNLTRDPELRTAPGGKDMCVFTLAVDRPGRDETDFVRVQAWGRQAETCGKYLQKGRKVLVAGPVCADGFLRRDGSAGAQLLVRSAERVEFLSPSGCPPEQGRQAEEDPPAPRSSSRPLVIPDEQLPF